jgi:septum formation protein
MPKIILASGSPRRRSLLAALGVSFDVETSDADEIFAGECPDALVIENARRKRDDVAARTTGKAIIIAADTLVFYEEHVLPKPKDLAEACSMLRRLSGNTHQVRTGLAIVNTATGQAVEGVECTDVTFRDLSDGEIQRFVEIVNPVDRAGAYTGDGPGSLLIARYDGCYQNVLGLPIVRLDRLLRQLGIALFDMLDPEQAVFL